MENKLLVILDNGKYAVTMNTGKEKDGQPVFGLLRSFEYPVDALAYASGIVDGWRLAQKIGGYFIPFDSDYIKVTPEVAAVLNSIIRPVEKSKVN
ncbi:hypothetical protein [Sporomusa acidovorans]|uniref:Uncharacterized protein n=1 Tax=Sporomusa acidovorans (strain ATCC 49682 / DSM 3132 / Mol) TaxID=1123286 RepID=A0ABZ3IZ54_SPOA4|nr:hypothetical protein [Sporomusa acidovorans]OZC22081.1 hypothetical protein SPACI_15990 [Sporomusa acidovorans DSM 3132]SDF65956.1 hypothetical protein SAMN04488499_10666 [Sporomusa acidovorans]